MIDINDSWYRVSVKALILNEKGEFLLCKESKGVWDFPGGGLDYNENPIDCLKRELFEEMGLETEEIIEKPEFFITAYKENSKTRPYIANIFYKVKLKNLNFKESDECIEIGFFDKKKVLEINSIENVKQFFKKYN
ncbi:NUDIX domain-containing protein [Candidatus Gracilibacteria bacterium]|nr:NUDIX domain-containing protein [Candidatus Gracilibacteria bacterium]